MKDKKLSLNKTTITKLNNLNHIVAGGTVNNANTTYTVYTTKDQGTTTKTVTGHVFTEDSTP